MAEVYSVQLPDGRTIQKELPDGATDGQIRKAFAKEMHDAGINVMRQQIQRPSNEDYWREKLGDQGQISNPDFDLGETLEGSLGDLLANALSERDARRFAKKAFNAVNDLTPIGDVVSMERGGSEFYDGLTRGDLGRMAVGAGSFALSALPLNGQVQRKGEDWLRALMADESGAIRAWHGSPHDFDRFDMSKIGTGEGAQAYGHGLYFAEHPDTARSYRDALITRDVQANGWNMKVGGKSVEDIYRQIDERAARLPIAQAQAEYDKLAAIESLMQHGDPMGVVESGQISEPALTWFNREIAPSFKRDGRLYEVNINAEPEDFLDWDAPVLQQPEAAQNFLAQRSGSIDRYLGTPIAGLVKSGQYGDAARAIPNEDWLGAGIPGIRYLDQGSRNAADGTRNYVVFDDSLIDILNKF